MPAKKPRQSRAESRYYAKQKLTRRMGAKKRSGHWEPRKRYDDRCTACEGSGLVFSVIGKRYEACGACQP